MKYDNMLNGIPTLPGIYMWTNNLNGKKYIGQSVNLRERLQSHLERFKTNKEHKYLYNAINKYGLENFSISIIKVMEGASKEELDQAEISFIKEYDSMNNGYNRTTGGDGGEHGCFCCEETQKKLRNIAMDQIERQRAEGRFNFFIWDIQKKKLYKCDSTEKASTVLKTSQDSIKHALKGICKIHNRFVIGRTLQDIKDFLSKKRGSSRYDIQVMCNYLKEHPEDSNLSISRKFEVSTVTIAKYRKKLGLQKEKSPEYTIIKGETEFTGSINKCSQIIGVNTSSLFRAIPKYADSDKLYRGWKIIKL